MKNFLLTLLSFVSLGLSAQQLPNYRALFWRQIAGTCEGGEVLWQKSVEELGEGAKYGKETHTYRIDCGRVQATDLESGKAAPVKMSEFGYLFEFMFRDPYLEDYLELEKEGQSVTATVREGDEERSPLHRQVFSVDDSSGVLRYAEVHVVRENMLYDLEVKIKVWFDAEGRYERHETETVSAVSLSGTLHTRIEGRIGS